MDGLTEQLRTLTCKNRPLTLCVRRRLIITAIGNVHSNTESSLSTSSLVQVEQLFRCVCVRVFKQSLLNETTSDVDNWHVDPF